MIIYNEYKPIRLDADLPSSARSWRNSPAIRKWCRQFTLIDEYQQAHWLESQASNPTVKMFGIAAESRYIGVCGFTDIDMVNRNAEFSLYIEPASQRKGYGRKALLTLFRHGFDDWGFKRIWGETFDNNPALKVFLDVGMKKEGCFRSAYFRRGKWIDSHIVGLLDNEWQLKHSKNKLKAV